MSDTTTKLCPCCGRSMEGFAFKGFSYDETLAKIGKVHRVGDMVINFETLRCTKAGAIVKLTKNAWKYLAILMSCSGNPVSRETLYRMVVGLDGGTTRTVDTFISMLRHHFGSHIEKVCGIGYRWTDTPNDKYARKITHCVRKKRKKVPVIESKPEQSASVVAEAVKAMGKVKALAPIPVKIATPMVVKSMPPLPESSERIYRVRGTHIQWNGKGTMPELLAAYQQVKGELPSFITLPLGHIRFNLGDHSVTWTGKGPLPFEVLHHLDEFATLPPWTRSESACKRRSANHSRTLCG